MKHITHRIVLFLLLTFALSSVKGQVLIDTAKVWNVLYRHGTAITKCYKFTKDTLIEEKKYSELRYSFTENFDVNNSRVACYMRESESAVYIRYQNDEQYLLYDFSLAIHDTIDLGFLNGEINLQLAVDTITYIEIDSITRKVMHMKPLDASLTIPQLWIEGIGSTHGIIEVGRTQMFSDETALLCFKDVIRESVLWQSTLGVCYFSNAQKGKTIVFGADKKKSKNKDSLEQEVVEEGIPASPQPTSSFLVINSNLENSGLRLKIYDSFGELVEMRTIKKEKDLRFDKLESGEYLIQVTDLFDKIYASKKIKI